MRSTASLRLWIPARLDQFKADAVRVPSIGGGLDGHSRTGGDGLQVGHSDGAVGLSLSHPVTVMVVPASKASADFVVNSRRPILVEAPMPTPLEPTRQAPTRPSCFLRTAGPAGLGSSHASDCLLSHTVPVSDLTESDSRYSRSGGFVCGTLLLRARVGGDERSLLNRESNILEREVPRQLCVTLY